MTGTTSRGAPYATGGDSNDLAGVSQALAQWMNDRPGISTYSTTQRNTLAAPELWAGRVIWNTTTARYERFDGNNWVALDARARFVTGTRATGGPSSDNYSGTATIGGTIWPSAPAGQYLLHSQFALQATGGNPIPASGVFSVNGSPVGNGVRMDVPGFAATYTHAHPYSHPGGDLNFLVQHIVGSAICTVYNQDSGRVTIEYLGPTA